MSYDFKDILLNKRAKSGQAVQSLGPPVDEEDLDIRILLIHYPAHSNIGYIRMSWSLAGCSTPAGLGTTVKCSNQTSDVRVADRYHCDLIYYAQKGYIGICLTPALCQQP